MSLTVNEKWIKAWCDSRSPTPAKIFWKKFGRWPTKEELFAYFRKG